LPGSSPLLKAENRKQENRDAQKWRVPVRSGPLRCKQEPILAGGDEPEADSKKQQTDF